MRNTKKWFETAWRLAKIHGVGLQEEDALLHLAFLAFSSGEAKEAMDRLQQYLQLEEQEGPPWYLQSLQGLRQRDILIFIQAQEPDWKGMGRVYQRHGLEFFF